MARKLYRTSGICLTLLLLGSFYHCWAFGSDAFAWHLRKEPAIYCSFVETPSSYLLNSVDPVFFKPKFPFEFFITLKISDLGSEPGVPGVEPVGDGRVADVGLNRI